MFSTPFATAARAARRAVPSLGLAAALLTSTFGASVPAFADEPIVHDHRNGGPPAARIQIILKGVHVIDDRDWLGDGEMQFDAALICFATPTPCEGYGSGYVDGYERTFSATSGETVPFDNHVMPDPGFLGRRTDLPEEASDALYPGHSYQLHIFMTERDPGGDFDDMGEREIMLTEANDWGLHGGTDNTGNYTLKSVRQDGKGWGDYEVEFEVRKAPLPDLRPVNITVSDLPGSTKKHVCMAVQNIETVAAGPFTVSLLVDDAPTTLAAATAPGLTPGNASEACVDVALPAGPHKLSAVADLGNKVLEYNEANNVYEQQVTVAAVASGTASPNGQGEPTTKTDADQGQTSKPTGAATATRPDLTVSAIKVNGQVPDGKDDCKDGKSPVTVVVKNGGDATAASASVRLTLDGAEVGTQSANGLEAGQEQEVRFEDVRLKKGEHKLAATVDPKGAVAETKDDNNTLKVSVACTAAN